MGNGAGESSKELDENGETVESLEACSVRGEVNGLEHGGVIKDSGLPTRTSVASSIQLLSWSMRLGDDGDTKGGSEPSGEGEGEMKGLGCPTRTNVASSIQLFTSSTTPSISAY